MVDGIINIYKEKGYTSFDIVAILRKKLKIKKIGHTGTLDPQAEGVLPVCIGKATKAVDYLVNKQKTYKAAMKLGIKTDTQDHTGNIIEVSEAKHTNDEILKVINSFIGAYNQIPPMFSALKVNGKRLYELAREGKTIERKPRNIMIYDIKDIKIEDDIVFLRVICSKGTYIRTLCHDIGEKLGCGAHMISLIREKTGNFDIQNSLKIDEIDKLIKDDRIKEKIIHVEQVFIEFPKVYVKSAFNKPLYNGNKLEEDFLIDTNLELNLKYRVYDENNSFIGLYICNISNEIKFLKPVTLFI